MALEIYKAKLVGLRPGFMPQNGILSDEESPEHKEMQKAISNVKNLKNAEARRQYCETSARLKMYVDEQDRPVIPVAMLSKALYEGGVVEKAMTAGKRVAGMTVLEDALLEYDGPDTATELAKDEAFWFKSMVTRQRVRIFDCRPIFKKWSAEVLVEIDTDMVNPDEARSFLENAGRYTGIGSWRPKLKGGKHGRWLVDSWEKVEQSLDVAAE